MWLLLVAIILLIWIVSSSFATDSKLGPIAPEGYNKFMIGKRKDRKGYDILAEAVLTQYSIDLNGVMAQNKKPTRGFCIMTCPDYLDKDHNVVEHFQHISEAKKFLDMKFHVDYKERKNKVYIQYTDFYHDVYETIH